MNEIEFPINTKAYSDGFYKFRGLQIACGDGVYVETANADLFFENMLFFIKKNNPLENLTMIDMGTGNGMLGIAMALEIPNSIIYGVEKYEKPFFWATKNANAFKEQIDKNNSKFITVMCSALDSINHLNQLHGQVDVVIASYPSLPFPDDLSKFDNLNIPYDLTAVFCGENGLEVIKEIIAASSILLKKGGILVVSVPPKMFEQVKSLLNDSVWSKIIKSPLHIMVTVKN